MRYLPLHVFGQSSYCNLRAIHVTGGIHSHAFSCSSLGTCRLMTGNKEADFAVLRASNPHAFLPTRMAGGAGFRVDRIQRVVFVDVNPADAAELLPLRQKFSILVEDLEAHIPAIGNKQAPSRIERESMWCAEFA